MSTRALNMDNLPFPERLLIWSLRTSYSPLISGLDTKHSLEHAFRFAHIERALPYFHTCANTIAIALMDAQATVDLHRPPCPVVGRDEWHMVQAIAALQSRDRLLAGSYLEPLLPAAGIRIACDSGSELARMLSRLNFRLRPAALHPEEFTYAGHHSVANDPVTQTLH